MSRTLRRSKAQLSFLMSHSAEPNYEELTPTTDADPSRVTESRHRSPRTRSRWPVSVPTVIAVVALGMASWSLVRPLLEADTSPTGPQVAEASERACTAYGRVRAAVALQTHLDIGSDQVALQAVAANARLAMSVGSQHLLASLSPNVPSELSVPIAALATDLQTLTINALAGAPDNDSSQIDTLRSIEAKSAKILDLCKTEGSN